MRKQDSIYVLTVKITKFPNGMMGNGVIAYIFLELMLGLKLYLSTKVIKILMSERYYKLKRYIILN